MFMQDDAGIIYLCNEGENSSNLESYWYLSSAIKERNSITELCNDGEVSFVDMETIVDVDALKRSVKNFM